LLSQSKFNIRVFEQEQTEQKKVVVLEFEYPSQYPNQLPILKLDTSQNDFLTKEGKAKIIDALNIQAEPLLGTPMIYTLVEHLRAEFPTFVNSETTIPMKKEGDMNKSLWESVISKQIEETADDKARKLQMEAARQAKLEEKQEKQNNKLSKAQKRRMVEQIDQKTGEKPRGWNWVDVIAHLSKKGSSAT